MSTNLPPAVTAINSLGAIFDAAIEREVQKREAARKPDCRNCGGDGYTHDAPVCPACHGTGKES